MILKLIFFKFKIDIVLVYGIINVYDIYILYLLGFEFIINFGILFVELGMFYF